MRSQYINNISKNIELYKEKCQYLRYNRDEMCHSIKNIYRKIPKKLELVFEPFDCIKSWEEMYKNLFYGDLYFYSPGNLPFIYTRYIDKLENKLQKTILDFMILDKYNRLLDKQLTLLDKNQSDINIYGYPKTEIIKNLKKMMSEADKYIEKKDKVSSIKKLFEYLAEEYPKKFLNDNNQFCSVVKEKLIEFRYKNNIKQAKVWWRAIFKTRMPLQTP